MKKWLWIIGFLFLAVAAFGQSDNTLYARNFPGSTVGVKVTNAQGSCNPDSAIPCIIVIDPTLAAYPSGTMPTKCAHCIWWDYRTVDGGLFVNTLAGGAGINCNPSYGDVTCTLDSALPAGETATTQAIGDTSNQVATDAFVSNQISGVTPNSFGAADLIAGSNDNEITFSSLPIKGTVALWQDDALVPPSDYNVSGSNLTLNGYLFATGSQIEVYWESSASTAGGATLSASGTNASQVRQAVSGNFIAPNPQGTNGANINFPLPPETQPGDMVLIIAYGDPGGSLKDFNVPSGWTVPGGTLQFEAAIYKIATQADVQAGQVTVNAYGGGAVSYTSIDFAGPTGGFREWDSYHMSGGGTSYQESTSANVVAGDALIAEGDDDIPNQITNSGSVPLASISQNPAMAVSYTAVTSPGAQTLTYTYGTRADYPFANLFVVEAGSPQTLNIEPANYVYAGPSSGSSALPGWRKLTQADLPAGFSLSTTPDTASPSTYASIQSAVVGNDTGSPAICTTGGSSYDTCTMAVTWPHAFSSANYQVNCTGLGMIDSGNPTTGRAVENGIPVSGQTSTGVTVQFATQGANVITYSGMECVAMQNAGQ